MLAPVVAVAAFSLFAAGCGGGSGSPGVANVASSTASAAAATQNGAFAFAHCLRSHGLPGWPDPTSDGGFDKAKLRQLGYSVARVRAVEDGPCNHLFGSSSQGPTITLTDRADYLQAAACMRTHGFRDFPDPIFQDNNVRTSIPSSIDQDSSQFKSAAATCTKLIPAGLPYSGGGRR
jgi:hypothetical protein